jgi:hypothetical protein
MTPLRNLPPVPGSGTMSADLHRQLSSFSEYSDTLASRALLYGVMPKAFMQELRLADNEKLVTLLYYVFVRGQEVGAATAEYNARKTEQDKLHAEASRIAKGRLQWVLDNFDQLEVDE